ncbi:MAG: Rieske (2Fe-2S) protein [Planctomycetota bacterium]|nr:MAG: Rieske (2Fe-2S) protein [Planctomycetota bacterium]
MLGKLGDLFRGKPVVIKGTRKLQDGMARKVTFGDLLAGTGKEILMCRVGGALHALDARCPHEGGRLSEGPLAEGKLAVCPLHNYQFEPTSGRCVNAACKNAKRYKLREVGDDCELWI